MAQSSLEVKVLFQPSSIVGTVHAAFFDHFFDTPILVEEVKKKVKKKQNERSLLYYSAITLCSFFTYRYLTTRESKNMQQYFFWKIFSRISIP